MNFMKRFDKNEIKAVTNVIRSNSLLSGFTTKFRGGEEVQKFEEEFAKFIGVKHALTVNSGTTALFVAIKTIIEHGIKTKKLKSKQPDIHIPAYTFTADASAALQAGGKIVFEDINKKTFCMLPPKCISSITIPTHLLGNAIPKINFGKTKFSIEDCCQALGTKINGKRVGQFGSMSVFSFQETKHITTLGEGGMVCSNNSVLMEIAASIRNHAEYYLQKPYLGYNFRMTEAQAAFGRVQLKKIGQILKKIRENARYVISRLPNGFDPPYVPPKVEHSFLIIGCLYNEKKVGINREIFLKKLTKNREHFLKNDLNSDIKGINMKSGKLISQGYTLPLYEIPAYRKYRPKRGCPNVTDVISKSIWLDIHRFREKNEISEEMDIFNDTVRMLQR